MGYAPTGTATCPVCKAKIAKGALRVGRATPNPWDAEGGRSDYTKFFHLDHAFEAALRSRSDSKVPSTTRALAGFGALEAGDRRLVDAKVKAFAAKWAAKIKRAA